MDKYGQVLLQANGVIGRAGPASFVIDDGMGFGDEAVWWPSTWLKRPVPHEGVDYVRYRTSPEGVQAVWRGFRIVSPVAGRVVALCRDFLDESIWIHPEHQTDILLAFAHVSANVVVGQRIGCGDLLGQIKYKACNVPHHLHLSVLRGDWRSIANFDWQELQGQAKTCFVPPRQWLNSNLCPNLTFI